MSSSGEMIEMLGIDIEPNRCVIDDRITLNFVFNCDRDLRDAW